MDLEENEADGAVVVEQGPSDHIVAVLVEGSPAGSTSFGLPLRPKRGRAGPWEKEEVQADSDVQEIGEVELAGSRNTRRKKATDDGPGPTEVVPEPPTHTHAPESSPSVPDGRKRRKKKAA